MKKIVKKICYGKESLAWYNNYIYFVKKVLQKIFYPSVLKGRYKKLIQ